MTATENRWQVVRANYFRPSFLICAAVLAAAGVGMSAVVKLSGTYMKKEPLPLRKTLSLLDEGGLAPYRVTVKSEIRNPDVLETLGTQDYIQWELEDTRAEERSATRHCMLFITYYSQPDRVPHVPEECYTGGGYKRVSSEDVTLTVSWAGEQRRVPMRYLVFSGTEGSLRMEELSFPVLYAMSVDGEYAEGREGVRLILNRNLFGKSSYFSKVEWKFFNKQYGRVEYPKREEALAASERLLRTILPVLEREHWPVTGASGK